MIIISLFGGLGNQMFQYATGKALAIKLNTELRFDLTYLRDKTPKENFTYRDFELNIFNIEEKEASIDEIRKYVPNLWNCTKTDLLRYKVKRFINGKNYYFEKKKYIYEKQIEQINKNSYIYGYFQSEKYFLNYKKDIAEAFQLKLPPDSINAELIEKIKNCNSVSVHIRRGDYQNSPFELLGINEYYTKAIELINLQQDNPIFFIFTNDYEWTFAQFNNLNIEKRFITHNREQNSYMDMILMSNCKHNICANSSFSWWGAWLNQNGKKTVIVPQNWFRKISSDNLDLVPTDWIKI
jgi:hypothetical protein